MPAALTPLPTPHSPLPSGTAWHPRALHLLSLPNHSLLDIAEALAIPLHQLARFVLSREGLEAATDIQAASIIHARTTAATLLPKVVSLLSQTLDDFLKTSGTERATPEPNTPDATTLSPGKPAAPTTPTVEAHHHRALRAAHLLVRLVNFQPKPFQRLSASTTPPTDGPAPQSPRLQPGHGQPALVEYAVTLPINQHALADAPLSSDPPNLTTSPIHNPAPQSPRLQPGHGQPTPVERAVTLPINQHASANAPTSSAPPTRASPAPDAPWESDRCEGRSEPPLASPSNHRHPLPPPGRTTHQQQTARPTLPPTNAESRMPNAGTSSPLPIAHSPLPSLHPP